MATLVLQTVGSAVGGAVGGPIGAVIGSAVGAAAGSYVDQQLFGPGDKNIVGPRLDSAAIQTSREGTSIPRVFGRGRVTGEVLWATNFEELATTQTENQGGKGNRGPSTTTTTYRYFANFAVGLCEGPISSVRRIWADGKILDQSRYEIRIHKGSETQHPDGLIEVKQGEDNAPAYRGIAYIVFERFPIETFGNRIPQISAEIIHAIGELEQNVRAVNLIPGATEFGYDPNPVVERTSTVNSNALNVHQSLADTDFLASLDEILEICPNLEQISLVVAWFGTDLRAGSCRILPKVEVQSRDIESGIDWTVAGVARANAELVSTVDGRPAYGGTPSDQSVVAAIQEIHSRGVKVALHPFVMMDISADNLIPDPYGAEQQPRYPWRGRLTCMPARGRPDSASGTMIADEQIASIVGEVSAADIVINDNTISHTQSVEWSFRRFIIHYARLAELAGGVDMFILGSEMRGLTSVQGESGNFPFVDALVDLSDDVRDIVGTSCRITYGADWSEYFGFQPADGSNDVFYNLDPLWSSQNIDFVGIDNYFPLSDWRDVHGLHPDGRAAADINLLAAGIAGGELFDWYYKSESDRSLLKRSAIQDGLGKPWVFRPKDLENWWANKHYERVAGIERSKPTDWRPFSKPFVFTELGCPAIHNGANQPNVFFDSKSSESHTPHFSNGGMDPQIQASFIAAHQAHWDDQHPNFVDSNNPMSPAYTGRMVDAGLSHLWAWDARSFPDFPTRTDLWSDGGNWNTGHWLNGRLGGLRISDLLAELLSFSGLSNFNVDKVYGFVDGFIIAETGSVRQSIEGLVSLYQISVAETAGELVMESPANDPVTSLIDEQLVMNEGEPLVSHRREQIEELPVGTSLEFIDRTRDYQPAKTVASRTSRSHLAQHRISLPMVADEQQLNTVLEDWLKSRWVGRDTIKISLPRSHINIAVGHEFVLEQDTASRRWRVNSIEEAEALVIYATAVTNLENRPPKLAVVQPVSTKFLKLGRPRVEFMDLPLLPHSDREDSNRIAVAADPWPGLMAVYASSGTGSFSLIQTVELMASVGHLPEGLFATHATSRWNYGGPVEIKLDTGVLTSVSSIDVMNGKNSLAVQTHHGDWEILQFQEAELIGDNRWLIRNLLRGQLGTEREAADGAPAGSSVVVLNEAVQNLGSGQPFSGLDISWKVGPAASSLADPEFFAGTYMPGYRGLTPYSPVHVRVDKDASDISIHWVRRNRIDADDWNYVEVPQSEDRELYRVLLEDVSSGTSATFDTQQPSLALSVAEMRQILGSKAAELKGTVSQMSEKTGAGLPAQFSIHL